MKILKKSLNARITKAEILVVFGCKGKKIKLPPGVKLPLGSVEDTNLEFGEARITDSIEGPFQQVLLVGLGDLEKVDSERVRRSAALAINETKKQKKESVTFWISKKFNQVPSSLGQAIAEGAVMSSYSLETFKQTSDVKVKRITFHSDPKVMNGITME